MKYKKYMSMKTRSKVMNANVLSLFKYGIEQYLGETEVVKQRLHTSIMEIFRRVRGFIRNRESNHCIAEDLGVELPNQMLLKHSVKFIHKAAYTGLPLQITELMRLPTWRKEGDNACIFPSKVEAVKKFPE